MALPPGGRHRRRRLAFRNGPLRPSQDLPHDKRQPHCGDRETDPVARRPRPHGRRRPHLQGGRGHQGVLGRQRPERAQDLPRVGHQVRLVRAEQALPRKVLGRRDGPGGHFVQVAFHRRRYWWYHVAVGDLRSGDAQDACSVQPRPITGMAQYPEDVEDNVARGRPADILPWFRGE